jgi:hypothetical protein
MLCLAVVMLGAFLWNLRMDHYSAPQLLGPAGAPPLGTTGKLLHRPRVCWDAKDDATSTRHPAVVRGDFVRLTASDVGPLCRWGPGHGTALIQK